MSTEIWTCVVITALFLHPVSGLISSLKALLHIQHWFPEEDRFQEECRFREEYWFPAAYLVSNRL